MGRIVVKTLCMTAALLFCAWVGEAASISGTVTGGIFL